MNKDKEKRETIVTRIVDGTDMNDLKDGPWYKWGGKPQDVKDFTSKSRIIIVHGKKKEH